MDRRVLVGAGLVAAALIAAVVWFVSSDGVSAPDAVDYLPPPEVAPEPATPPEAPRARARAAVAEAVAVADAGPPSDDAPPNDDGKPIRVTGIVIDDAGAKVPGATVSAWRMRRGVRTDDVETKSDASGRFVLANVAKGSRIAARADALSPVQERCGVCDTEMLLRVERRRLITGRFVRADHPELPAVGVPVRVPGGTTVWSDPEGRWSFTEKVDARAEFTVSPRGAEGASLWESLVVSVDPDASEIRMQVMPLVTIRGRVTGPDGNAIRAWCEWRPITYGGGEDDGLGRAVVAGAIVRRVADSSRVNSAYASESGAFQIANVRPGRGTLSIRPGNDGDLVDALLVVELRAGVPGDSAPVRRDTFVLGGERPELDPDAFAPPWAGGPEPDDSDAMAVREWDERFDRWIAERRAAKARAEEEADRRALLAGTTSESLDIHLVRGESITGRVVGPDGPIANASVMAMLARRVHELDSRRTDADGGFRIRGLPPGAAIALFVSPPGSGWEPSSPHLATAGDRNVEIRVVRRAPALTGVVVDSEGAIARGRSVSARRREPGDESAIGLPPVRTDADGRFHIPAEPNSTYVLAVDGVTVGEGTTSDKLTLRLPALHRLTVRVRSADGEPITAPVWIDIWEPEWDFVAQVRDGSLRIDSAPAGTYSVMLVVGERPSGDAPRIGERRAPLAAGMTALIHLETREVSIPCGEIEFVVPARPR